jgi:hypothetical protein
MRGSRIAPLALFVCLLAAPQSAHATASAQEASLGNTACQLGTALICTAGSLLDGAGGLVGDVAQAGTNAVMGGIVDWAAGGAAWLLRTIATQVDRSTRPDLGSPWFSRRYAAMRSVAVAVSLAFLLVAIAHAALLHDLGLLMRSCLVALPSALLVMFAAVTLVELALALTDELSAAALQSTGADVRQAFSDLGRVLLPADSASPAMPGFLVFIAAVLTSFLALLVWLELVLREAAVYLAMAFMPLALAAAVWPHTRHWSQRLAGWLSALILSKLTIATAFSLAGAMVANARPGSGGMSALLAGCAVLVLAAVSPWVLLRLIPFTAGDQGLHRSQLSGAVSHAPGAGAALLLARRGMASTRGGPGPAAVASGRPWAPSAARAVTSREGVNDVAQ